MRLTRGLASSFQQEQARALDARWGGGAPQNLAWALRIVGRLDVRALASALARACARHEPLRAVAAAPCASVAPPLHLVDLTGLPRPLAAAALDRRCRSEAARPLEPVAEPARATLLALGPLEHVLVWVAHRGAFDARSLPLLLAELAGRGGGACPAHAAYAAAQRGAAAEPAAAARLAAWLSDLARRPALHLPAARPPGAPAAPAGGAASHELAPATVRAVDGLAESHGLDLRALLHAAWAAVLHRHGAADDVLVCLGVDGRTERFGRSIGGFEAVLPLPVDLAGGPTLAEAARATSAALAAAEAGGWFAPAAAAAAVRAERDGGLPVLRSALAVLPCGSPAGLGEHLVVRTRRLRDGQSRFDIGVEVEWGAGHGRVDAEYRLRRFDEATVRRLLAEYECLLREAARAPRRRLTERWPEAV